MPFDVYFYMRAERSRFRTSDLLAAVLEPTKCAGGDRRRASRIGNYYVRHNCLAAHIFDRRVLSLGDYAFRAWDPCAKMCSAHARDLCVTTQDHSRPAAAYTCLHATLH